MRAPDSLATPRLVLRRPVAADAQAIYERYARQPDVTRYVGWPAHRSVSDTQGFLEFALAEWDRWPAGPYLIESAATRQLLGGTGFGFDAPFRAATGYVLARDAWGYGYATEAMRAIVALAPRLGLRRLYAICHVDHRPSWRVLEKAGLTREAVLRNYAEFPNLDPPAVCDVFCYAIAFDQEGSPRP
jgi:RimJ/RimL family protein N-acetyltransferase